MLKAKDIMTTELITISPTAELSHATRLLLERRVNGIPVVDGEELVGIICQSDLVALQKKIRIPSLFTLFDGFIPLKTTKHFEKEVQKIVANRVEEIMTPNPVTVGVETTIEDIANLMVEKNFHTIPVVDEGKLVGIIGKEDILRTLMPGY